MRMPLPPPRRPPRHIRSAKRVTVMARYRTTASEVERRRAQSRRVRFPLKFRHMFQRTAKTPEPALRKPEDRRPPEMLHAIGAQHVIRVVFAVAMQHFVRFVLDP